MSTLSEPTLAPAMPGPREAPGLDSGMDRRADIDAKMALVANVLQETGCDGLLLLDPDNVAWLTSGATARGSLDPRDHPGVYCNGDARWLLCGNTDTQRMFDEELDGLGFQLKEWPYHWGREQLLADLCQGRKVACDQPFGDAVQVGNRLQPLRRVLTPYEQACLRSLGQIL